MVSTDLEQKYFHIRKRIPREGTKTILPDSLLALYGAVLENEYPERGRKQLLKTVSWRCKFILENEYPERGRKLSSV